MIFTTCTIDKSRTPLAVGQWHDDGILTVATPDGTTYRIPRFDIETPILSCSRCGLAVLLKTEKHSKKEYAECPQHARHMYEALFTGSHDVKRYNRAARHKMYKQAIHWLNRWQREFEARQKSDIECG